MSEVARIGPEEARRKVNNGALLVCAYEDEEKCRNVRLRGALTLGEFESKLSSISKDTEIIFYCM